MLGREKLSREDRIAVGLQLCNLLKRLRQRGSLKWTAADRLPDDEVPKKSAMNQGKAAELCGVSHRTIKSVENFCDNPKPPTQGTLQKIYDGLRRIAEDGAEPWHDFLHFSGGRCSLLAGGKERQHHSFPSRAAWIFPALNLETLPQ